MCGGVLNFRPRLQQHFLPGLGGGLFDGAGGSGGNGGVSWVMKIHDAGRQVEETLCPVP